MIGANNTGRSRQDPSETADGIKMILSSLCARCSDAKVLLLGVFPRGMQPNDPLRKINVAINEKISKLADGNNVHFVDISVKFLDEKGVLPKKIMGDALHLGKQDYQIWAGAIEQTLLKLGATPLRRKVTNEPAVK